MSTLIEAPAPAEIELPAISEEEGRRREVLIEAASLIERYGYVSGSEGMRPSGPFCLLGAVGKASRVHVFHTKDHHPSMSYADAAEVITGREYADGDSYEFYCWSDLQKYCRMPRKGLVSRMSRGERVAQVLRRIANGATWEQAIADTQYPRWFRK